MAVQFERVTPILPVRDVRVALAHYQRLGFEATAYDEAAAHPIYGFLAWGDVSLHLARVPDLDPARSAAACYLYVDDADALYAAWQSAEVDGRLTAITDTPYGLREFAHIDPDGNLLRVGAPLSANQNPADLSRPAMTAVRRPPSPSATHTADLALHQTVRSPVLRPQRIHNFTAISPTVEVARS